MNGPEHPSTLDTRHELALAKIKQGKTAEAEKDLADLVPLREKVQGPQHLSTLAARHALARAMLEEGKAKDAKTQLDAIGDSAQLVPRENAKHKMLRGWLSDLEGSAHVAEAYLDEANALLSDFRPAYNLRRDLARYRETRVPGAAGGTIV